MSYGRRSQPNSAGCAAIAWAVFALKSHYVEERVRYESNGLIVADDVDFNQQVNDVLNLNISPLKNSRQGVLDGVLDWWKNEKDRIRGPVPRKRFLGERDKHVSGTGELRPYSQVAVWWLDQRLAKMTT